MKRIITLLITLIVFVILWYLGDLSQQTKVQEESATMEGIIVISNSDVYLVEDSDFTRHEADNLSINEIIGTYPSVNRLSDVSSSLKNIKNGDKVIIWYTEIQESMPANIKVLKIQKK
ncbi:DUF3221 domain-containing protein [Robertmurraya sp. P23]|uniref:DUF3221 domain-containing protein n=1 Tax=Robertmurraya sp. P23 TaxID=3436931 RepID=UPI003D98D02D